MPDDVIVIGEEELQLQLALAMSKEEHDEEERKRKGDDVKLQLALEESRKETVRITVLDRNFPVIFWFIALGEINYALSKSQSIMYVGLWCGHYRVWDSVAIQISFGRTIRIFTAVCATYIN